MKTQTTPEQARYAAYLYRAAGTPISVTAVYSLADQVDALTKDNIEWMDHSVALTKERDAWRQAHDDQVAKLIEIANERDALMAAAKLALDALELIRRQVKAWDHGDDVIEALKKAGVK